VKEEGERIMARPATKRIAPALLAAASIAATTACGGPPPTVPDAGKQLKNINLVKGTGAQQPGTPGQQNDPRAQQQVWAQTVQEISRLRQTTVNLKCELVGYFVSIKDGKTGSTLSDFYWQKPNTTALVVNKSSDGATQGTKIVWAGGSQMKVKTKFLGFWMKTSLEIHNEYAKDQRGYFIDETGIGPVMDTLVDPRNQVSIEGTGTMDGLPIMKVAIKSPRSLKGVASEVYVIDTNRKVPLVREMYDASKKLVFRIQMNKLVLNSQLPPSTFAIE
jgi:outer membrane lipoprotein-sorting protein